MAAITLALVSVGLSVTPADAAVPRVFGITSIREDQYNARLTVRWRPVRGATYQVRWSGSKSGLARAQLQTVRSRSATSPKLDRCVTTYVQVRAVKRGVAGPWSAPRGLRFHNGYPSRAVLGGTGLENAVRFTWKYAPNVTRYRLRWNAAAWGNFPGGDTVAGDWTNQYARSVTVNLPTTPAPGDQMMGVAYANPVWGQMDTMNSCRSGVAKSLGYKPVFPKAPVPGPGDDLRLGTYNVELFPTNASSPSRINGIAKNIADHNLTVVTLQEATSATASSLDAKLPTKWRVAPPQSNAAQQILYDGSVFRAISSGVYNVPNPKPGTNPLATPWVVLELINPSSGSRSQDLFVTSIHFAENPAKTQMQKKHDVNGAALAALQGISAANTRGLPVVAAGDFRYLREPFNDLPGYVEGPPTFVRNGFFDAMAAVKKTNIQFPTVNGHKTQTAAASGVSSRSDYIMVKGFEGSRSYVNLANWKYNGSFVSDHNLVYADLTIPYK